MPFGVFGFDHFGQGETSVSLLSPAARFFGRLFCIGIDEPGVYDKQLPAARNDNSS